MSLNTPSAPSDLGISISYSTEPRSDCEDPPAEVTWHCPSCGRRLPLRKPRRGRASIWICVNCDQEQEAIFDLRAPEELWNRVLPSDHLGDSPT